MLKKYEGFLRTLIAAFMFLFLLSGCGDPCTSTFAQMITFTNYSCTYGSAPLSFSNSTSLQVTQQLQLSIQGGSSPYTFTLQSGSGSVNSTGFFTASTGVGSVNVLVTDSAGSELTVPLSVTAGPASQLAFLIQPASSGFPGVALSSQPVVAIEDAYENIVSIPSYSVNLTPFSNSACSQPPLGTLAATTNPVSSVDGESTFAGLNYNASVGTIYLQASAAGFTKCSAAIAVNPLIGQLGETAKSTEGFSSTIDSEGNIFVTGYTTGNLPSCTGVSANCSGSVPSQVSDDSIVPHNERHLI
jgi:hypothetical protein